jgi:hypothetical protein
MSMALGRAEKTGLNKVSKATNLMDRRIQHARQLFNERLARAQADYHDAVRRAATAEDEAEGTDSVTAEPVQAAV